MGYVAAFRKDDIFPPVAIVVTETVVDVLFFPLVKEADRLLTACHNSVQVWEDDGLTIKRNCLVLLACLSYIKGVQD